MVNPNLSELRSRAVNLARQPRTRKVGIWLVSIIVAVGILGALIAPPLVKQKLTSELSKILHREVSIEQLRINPYAMSATIRGFLIKERQGTGTAVSFEELYVNFKLSSLFRLAPIFKEIRLVKPYIHLIRNEDFTYSFTDLIEEFSRGPSDLKPKGPPGPPPRFSLNNIEIIDGRIDFDDRPKGAKHSVTSLHIGVPFISSLPSYVDIKVQPAFSAVIDGAPTGIGGETKPFKDSRESAIHLEIDKLQIPRYVEYSPVELNFKLPSGQIDGKLSASFKTAKDKPAVLTISGHVELKDLVMQEKDDTPIFSLPSFQVVLDAFEVFASRAGVKSIKIQRPELHVTRNRGGSLNLASLVAGDAKEKPPEEKKDGAPFAYRVDEIVLEQGKVFFRDQNASRPFEKRLENIHISVKGLTTEPDKKAETEISFQADGKEQFSHSGTLHLTPLSAEGKVQVEGLQLKNLRPYYENVVGVDIREGLLDLDTRFAVEQKEQIFDAKLSELNATLRSLRMDVPGEPEPLWRVPVLTIKDAAIDMGKKSASIGALESRGGNGFIQRGSGGTISYARLVKAQASEGPVKQREKTDKDAGWRVDAKRFQFDRFRLVFEDRSLAAPATTVVSELYVRAENLSNAKNSRGKATIRAKINNKGSIRLAGTAGTNPVGLRFDVEAKAIELLPLQPYIADRVNFLLTGGEIGTKGKLNVETIDNAPAKVTYQGDLQVTDFASVESSGETDLLKWKSLGLGGVKFSMQPVQINVDEITLAEFYSRVIIAPDGKINLQNLVAQKKEEPGPIAGSTGRQSPSVETTASTPTQVAIGKIKLKDGNINFSDFFIKPNYSVNLTQVQGAVSELKPEVPGDLQLRAKIDNAAPVDISGKINPLAKDLFLDIKANARDIELSPLTPYSARYVGYGIEKGKLSLEIQYRVENRKLSAQNKIILNQLTFGERIQSPTATKLPVLLAVALLKDRNGVIDINLPIGGSLDDPQFSVGGIIMRIILNIIIRAVTSPFALLGAAFGGGGGEELSYIEFDYGRANLTQAAEAKIKTLETAMNNRPALKLEISGRIDPTNDLEGIKRASIERKVKAQKMKELGRQGKAPKSVDEVQVDQAEYERFLRAAYRDEKFPKPRNFIGLVKDIPVSEMEALLLKHSQVGEDDLRELANRRAQVVRDRLLASGQVGADRLFLLGAKLLTADEKEKIKAKASRVEFSLR